MYQSSAGCCTGLVIKIEIKPAQTAFTKELDATISRMKEEKEELSVTLGKKSTTLKKVDANMFYGTWECEIFYNNIVDYYTVEFDDNNRVKVTVESTGRSGKTTKSSGSGRFVYSEDDKVFSLTVNRMSGSVKYVERISWKSIVNPSKDNNSFTMTIPTATSGGQQVRGEFYRID